MISCLLVAFYLCNPNPPPAYAYAPQQYYVPAPGYQPGYAVPVQPIYPTYAAPSVALNFGYNGWGGRYGQYGYWRH